MKKTVLILLITSLLLCGCSKQLVLTLNKEEGIAPSPEIETENSSEAVSDMLFNSIKLYDYKSMEVDLKNLTSFYSDITTLNVLGTTIDSRNIYEVIVGNINASKHIIIHASIHAREYITTKLVMKQLDDFLYQYTNGQSFAGKTYKELLADTALHIIPMVNPDGVSIAQYGPDAISNPNVRNSIMSMVAPGYNFSQWKANARGVDINRNFDALWSEYQGSPAPAPEMYKGEYPGCEEESKALIAVTTNYNVVRTISYHTYGEVIYWYFAQEGELLRSCESFTKALSDVAGYPADANYEKLDPAGYKDWAISKLSIPSVTIEVGHTLNPVPDEQFPNIWQQNRDVWCKVLHELSSPIQTASSAYSAGDTLVVFRCEKWISLRTEPSKEAVCIAEIPKGAEVKFISNSINGFYNIEYNGQVGYALSEYLTQGE